MRTIGVSWLTKDWIASTRFTLGMRSSIRASTRTILAMSILGSATQAPPVRLGEDVQARQVEQEGKALARLDEAWVEHLALYLASAELREQHRLGAERLCQGDGAIELDGLPAPRQPMAQRGQILRPEADH